MIHQNYPGKLMWKALLTLTVGLFTLIDMANAQMSITGTTCVFSGTQYTYTISGNWNSGTHMSWSVSSNGTISGSTSGTPLPQIHVTWNSGTSGTVYLTTTNPSSSPTLAISITTTLSAGSLSNTSQNIVTGTVPATINSASAASGGYCSPNYSYQWQQSTDNVNFTDITGATTLSLTFSTGLTQTMYYRRKVTETNTSTTAYTGSAAIYVYPPVVAGSVSPSSQEIAYGTNASAL